MSTLATPTASHVLSVTPRGRGEGFQANVRGHVLDLVDPGSYALAPTTDDLFIVSVAAALAWSARAFLRSHGLPDYVSVAAAWQSPADDASPVGVSLTVTVSSDAEAFRDALNAALEHSVTTRTLAKPVVHLSLEGVDR